MKAGRFTQEQADDMLARLTEHLDDFGRLRPERGHHWRGGPDELPAPPAMP